MQERKSSLWQKEGKFVSYAECGKRKMVLIELFGVLHNFVRAKDGAYALLGPEDILEK